MRTSLGSAAARARTQAARSNTSCALEHRLLDACKVEGAYCQAPDASMRKDVTDHPDARGAAPCPSDREVLAGLRDDRVLRRRRSAHGYQELMQECSGMPLGAGPGSISGTGYGMEARHLELRSLAPPPLVASLWAWAWMSRWTRISCWSVRESAMPSRLPGNKLQGHTGRPRNCSRELAA